MSEPIAVTHHDVEITYVEDANNWRYELGGREKFAKSLNEAKHAIDSAPKPKKAVVRFQAYLLAWGDTKVEEVTVGTLSKDYRGRPQFWISNNGGDRSKEDAMKLVKINDANNALVKEMRQLSQQIVTLQAERSAKAQLLERIDIPVEDE